MIYNFF